jgi:hypothetical protein
MRLDHGQGGERKELMEAKQTAMWFQYASLLVVLVIGITIGRCTASPTPKATQVPTPSKEGEMPTVDIVKVMETYQDELMEIPGVVGVGIGQSEATGERLISVFVDEMTPELQDLLPTELEGFEVKPQVTGPIQIQESPN